MSTIASENSKQKQRLFSSLRTFSFRIYIFTPIAFLIIVTVASIVSYIWYQYSKALSQISNDQMRQVTETVKEKVTNYLTPASVMAKLSSQTVEKGGFERHAVAAPGLGNVDNRPGNGTKIRLNPLITIDKTGSNVYIPEGVLSLTDHALLESYGIDLLKSFPQIAMVNIGDEQGNFMMPKKLPDGTIATKIINQNITPATVTWKYRDKEGNIIKTDTSTNIDYDPRTRPWYKGAKESKGLFWTDIYIFFSDQSPGITTSYPVINADGLVTGVFSLDIALSALSTFLKQLKVGETGIVYIINAEEKFIAYPDPSRIVKIGENGKPVPVRVDEFGIDWIVASFHEHKKTKSERIAFETKGKRYLASFADLGGSFEKAWKIGVVVPEEDFLGPLIRMRKVLLIISLIVLVTAVFIARLISRGVSKPIYALTDEAKKIEKFELDGKVNMTSSIREIQMMNQSISSMKKGLNAFKKYVPSALVRQLIQTGEEAKLGGKKLELTIMFTDIQGFTEISERIAPELLMIQLFEYNNELTNIILNHKGTIDKYIGDAIMAFWGAPVWYEDHAAVACEAALACHHKVEELNRKWKKEGKEEFVTRLGINTGQTIVGNMGSDERMNYSVLGDSVNLASRVEGVNKLYGTRLIVTEHTYEKVSQQFVFRLLDFVAVKGKEKPIRIYELIGKEGEVPDEMLILRDAFARGFDTYLKKRWDEALRIFVNIHKRFPKDKASELYIERCREFKENPPPKDWDGVARLKTK